MRQVRVLERQNIVDMALQIYGSVAAVIDLCIDNGLELDSNLQAAQMLKVQDNYPANSIPDNANYINGKGITVVSVSEVFSGYVFGNVLGDNNGDIIAINSTDYLGTD